MLIINQKSNIKNQNVIQNTKIELSQKFVDLRFMI